MQVWITKKLNELLFKDYNETLIVVDNDIFPIEYIKKAGIIDISILEFNRDYLSFLNDKKLKGIEGLTIFCNFKDNVTVDLIHYNAVVLNVNKIGIEDCKEIIKFIIHVQKEKYQPILWYQVNEINLPSHKREIPINSKEEVIKILTFPFENQQGLIIAFTIDEDGRNVTARGTCLIRDIRQNYFVVDRIKPTFVINGLKEDQIIKVVIPGKNLHYEGLCLLRAKKGEMLYLDLPEKLFIERRRHIRVEPSKKKPVYVYVHIPNEDSEPFEILDISLQGIAFLSEKDLSEQGIYTFAIFIKDIESIIISAGIIRYKIKIEGKYKYGVEFQLTEKDKEKIASYIRKREFEILENLKKTSTT